MWLPFAGKTSAWFGGGCAGRADFGGRCNKASTMCVAMETETGADDSDQWTKGSGAKNLQKGPKKGSWKGIYMYQHGYLWSSDCSTMF